MISMIFKDFKFHIKIIYSLITFSKDFVVDFYYLLSLSLPLKERGGVCGWLRGGGVLVLGGLG